MPALSVFFVNLLAFIRVISSSWQRWKFEQLPVVGCMEFIVPLENFSLIWRRHEVKVKGFKFWPMLGIEQWGFFNVPYPLRHGPTVYKGHLRSLRPMCKLVHWIFYFSNCLFWLWRDVKVEISVKCFSKSHKNKKKIKDMKILILKTQQILIYSQK